MDPEVRAYLSLLEADKRTIRLKLGSAEPLRSPTSKVQRKRFRKLRTELEEAARRRFHRKAAFRGQVSVDISLFVTGVVGTSTHRMVKAYVDLLKGVAYRDDSSIAHLMVDRLDLTAESPWDGLEGLPFTPPSHEPVEAFLTIKPLRIYREQLDRAVEASLEGEDWEWEIGTLRSSGMSPWEERLEPLEDAAELEEFVRDIDRLYPSLSPEERRELAIAYQRTADQARTATVTSIPFQMGDRPGAIMSASLLAGRHPGEISLSAPHAKPRDVPWKGEIENELREHRAGWRLLSRPLMAPIGLDIAVPDSTPFKDLDNLSAVVASGIERILFDDALGSVSTYRAYWVQASTSKLRVRLMDPIQMRALPETISRVHRGLGGNLP